MVDVVSSSKVKVVPDSDPRWAQCRAGDREACNSLVEEHLPLLFQVTDVMIRKFPSHIEIDELRSFGAFGLISAVDTYNPEKAAFRTHAVFRIKARIYDELRAIDWAPKTFRERVKEVDAVRAELERASGRPVSLEEVSLYMKKPRHYARSLQAEARATHHKPLDELADAEGSYDTVKELSHGADAETLREAAFCMDRMAEWVDTLTPRQQEVWALRFYKEMPPLRVAKKLGMRQTDVHVVLSDVMESFAAMVRELQSK